MQYRKALATLAVAAVLSASSIAARANTSFAGFTDVLPAATDYSLSGGAGGVFQSNPNGFNVVATGPSGAADIYSSAVFVFSPVTATAPVTQTSVGSTVNDAGSFSGGTFTIYSDSSKSTVLLTGNFSASQIKADDGSTSGNTTNFNSNTVTYTGGLYYDELLATNPGAASIVGNFSLALSGVNPAFLVGSDGYFQSFSAQGGAGTFDYQAISAAPVPEPGTMASLGFGTFGLLGLALMRRRRAVTLR